MMRSNAPWPGVRRFPSNIAIRNPDWIKVAKKTGEFTIGEQSLVELSFSLVYLKVSIPDFIENCISVTSCTPYRPYKEKKMAQ